MVKIGQDLQLFDKLAQAKWEFFGHFMRRERIKSRALLGRIEDGERNTEYVMDAYIYIASH